MSKKQLNTRIQYKYDSAENWANCDKPSLAGELYVHSHDDGSMSLSIGDGMRQIKDLPTLGGEPESNLVAKPYIPQPNMIYTGEWICIEDWVVGLNSDIMTVVNMGQSSQKQAGDYELLIQLHEGYYWEDETTDPISLPWSIVKGKDPIEYTNTLITLPADSDYIENSIYMKMKEPETATVTIQTIITSFDCTLRYSGDDNDFLLYMERIDSVDYSEDYVINATVRIDRTNYETEVLNLQLKVEALTTYTWNVYNTEQTLTSEDTGWESFEVSEIAYYPVTVQIYGKPDENGGFTDEVVIFPGQTAPDGSYVHIYDEEREEAWWTYSHTIVCKKDTYTHGKIRDGYGYKYSNPSKPYVQFNKGTELNEPVTSQDIFDYPDKDVKYSEEDNKWYYYELQM